MLRTNIPRLKPRTNFGIVLTLCWLILWGLVGWNKWEYASYMPLNEWGDFFAGLFAPVAFLWLVLGYFQQGDELALSTEALRAQVQETASLVREYARQAEASAKLAEVTALALEQERQSKLDSIRPDLHLGAQDVTSLRAQFAINNWGYPARHLAFDCPDGLTGKFPLRDTVRPGENAQLVIEPGDDAPRSRFRITCLDLAGRSHWFEFNYERGGASFANSGVGEPPPWS